MTEVRGKTAKVLRLLSGAQTITDNGNTLAWVKRKESITTVGPNALQPDERLNTIAKVGQNSDSANFVDKKTSESQKKQNSITDAVDEFRQQLDELVPRLCQITGHLDKTIVNH